MKKKDYAISFIRFLSLCMIIACHICQFYENELAWWLNCGVQIFLLISGFLYGQRDYIEPVEFYKRNIPKILIDYYLYLVVILPVYVLIAHYKITIIDFFKLLLGLGTDIPGLGHLWYISTIVVCYLITPLALRIIKPQIKMVSLFGLFIIAEVMGYIIPGITGAWINCYVIGLLLGNWYSFNRNTDFFKKISIVSTPCMLFLCGVEIAAKYMVHVEMNGIAGKILNTVFHYGHISLALFIFTGLMWRIHYHIDGNKEFISKFLGYSDKYSYDMYIVHLFFVLGPYSFFSNRSSALSIVGGVFLLIPTIVVCAIILRFIAKKAESTLHQNNY